MIIVGDIGNTETKICLVSSKNIIIKRVTFMTKKINFSLLKIILSKLNLKNKPIDKCLFCSVVPKSFNEIKSFFNKNYKIKCHELKKLKLHRDLLSKEKFIFFVIKVTLLIIIFLEFTKQILVSVFPISPTIIILNFYLCFLY